MSYVLQLHLHAYKLGHQKNLVHLFVDEETKVQSGVWVGILLTGGQSKQVMRTED